MLRRCGYFWRRRLAANGIALWLALAARAGANVAGGGDDGPDVTLHHNGENVVLANGIVTVTVNTAAAQVSAIRYKGRDMVDQHIYFSRDGGDDYEQLPHCVYKVTAQTPDMVDISCKHVYTPNAGDKHAWDVDVHFVLRRGMTGLYIYTINSHPAQYPEMGVGEWRMVWQMPKTSKEEFFFEKAYVDDLRHWKLPSAGDYARTVPVAGAPKEVMEFTTGPWKGKYDCKYVYAAIYQELGCWGYASDKNRMGAWYVFGSHEFFTDGPTKQDLTATFGLNLVHLNMNHYGGTGPELAQGEAWEKIYGPWLLYFNNAETGDACWADAQEQAKAEAAAWPYAWLANTTVYPLAEQRGGVSGKFVVKDTLKPAVSGANAWVGLALPESGKEGGFQYQSAGYQYWVRAGADGSFTIPSVRPGSYTLYAFTNGAVGEFSKNTVLVTAGQTLALGDLEWDVPHHGTKIAWEIGVPDRSSREFKHGNDFYVPLLYKSFPKEFKNPLEYYVGKSDWTKDWNYAQSYYFDGSKMGPHIWRIHFNLDSAPEGKATLTLALAGTHQARLEVSVNGGAPVAVPLKNQGGNALVRESDHAKYEVDYVTIPEGKLKAGENTIALTQTDVKSDQASVMYDYLNLELP
jgi:rhamnogalacturonan endolyase